MVKSIDYLLELNTSETVDISYLDSEEKKMIYSMLDYFKKYGSTVRNLSRQVEDDYERIKDIAEHTSERAVKELVEEIMSIKDLFD